MDVYDIFRIKKYVDIVEGRNKHRKYRYYKNGDENPKYREDKFLIVKGKECF